MLIAAVAYIAFRLWAQSLIGGTYGFGSGQANKGLLSNIYFALSSNKRGEHAALFDTFHFFWLLFAYGLYHQYRKHGPRNELLVAGGWLILCCLAGRMVATDTQRVFVMLAPLVIALVAITLDNQRTNALRLLTGVLVFLYLALNLQFVPNETKFLVELAGLAFFALLILPLPRILPTRHRQEHDGGEHFIPHRGVLDPTTSTHGRWRQNSRPADGRQFPD
ncbi:hypothetical protein NQK81_39170 [Amycolatopsis roodepoortensis]|uniref:hypothetical protein n=1 Tax=Amycolatopsis roodepoortensis TaxID=700274 RepID=UPI00214B7AE8|nr:hypothetical protein [Amycolatopsis roodepoortensis]UUV30723.1 hypothetical protein NQK81_39170 [Amycolatopsis roodepoortensis]